MRWRKGNVLFLILLAVVLFAALSYVVTQSSRSSGKNISAEAAEAGAARILQFFTLLEATVQRMILSGVPLTQIDFYHAEIAGSQNNSLCNEDECHVFRPGGGGVSPVNFEDLTEAQTSVNIAGREGHLNFSVINVVGLGTSSNELAVRILGINDNICYLINQKHNLPDSPAFGFTGGAEVYASWSANVNGVLNASNVRMFGDDAPDLIGQRTFCIQQDGDSWLYHVLVPR